MAANDLAMQGAKTSAGMPLINLKNSIANTGRLNGITNCWIGEKLQQLECLRSEDTPHHLMITHTIESYWIPSQKKTKSKLQLYRICKISNILILK